MRTEEGYKHGNHVLLDGPRHEHINKVTPLWAKQLEETYDQWEREGVNTEKLAATVMNALNDGKEYWPYIHLYSSEVPHHAGEDVWAPYWYDIKPNGGGWKEELNETDLEQLSMLYRAYIRNNRKVYGKNGPRISVTLPVDDVKNLVNMLEEFETEWETGLSESQNRLLKKVKDQLFFAHGG